MIIILVFEKVNFTVRVCGKIAGGIGNNVDPDQTAPKEQSDQGLHCLPKHVHLNILGSFGNNKVC